MERDEVVDRVSDHVDDEGVEIVYDIEDGQVWLSALRVDFRLVLASVSVSFAGSILLP